MNIQSLKIELVQKILSTTDVVLLKKLYNLLENSIIGYDSNGNPVTKNQYIEEMDKILFEIDNETAKLFTSDEIIRQIKSSNEFK